LPWLRLPLSKPRWSLKNLGTLYGRWAIFVMDHAAWVSLVQPSALQRAQERLAKHALRE
jgi:hypothetical protein